MPTHYERYHGNFNSLNGENYTFKIFDKNYSGSAPSLPVETGSGGVKLIMIQVDKRSLVRL